MPSFVAQLAKLLFADCESARRDHDRRLAACETADKAVCATGLRASGASLCAFASSRLCVKTFGDV
jgi:hypothetical protein